MDRLQPAPPSSVPGVCACRCCEWLAPTQVALTLGVFTRVCSDAQPTADKMLEMDTPPPDPNTKSIGNGAVDEHTEGGGGVPIEGVKKEVRARTSRAAQTAMPRRMRLRGLWRRRCLTRRASGPSYH